VDLVAKTNRREPSVVGLYAGRLAGFVKLFGRLGIGLALGRIGGGGGVLSNAGFRKRLLVLASIGFRSV